MLRLGTIRGAVKRAVNSQLAHLDLAIAREDVVPSLERFFSALRRSNLTPRTVIDVGVAYGTDWLYNAFPGAKFHLVDPTAESLPYMNAWAQKLDAEIHNIALGSEEGSLELARTEKLLNNTLLDLVPGTANPIQGKYKVSVQRFDKVFSDMDGPVLCKIDVEGAELMVLRGMGERIRSLDALIIETSMNSLYENGPDFDEIVRHMSEQGFSFYDIGALVRRPYDGALHQMDAIFVPDRSPLRIRRWS